MPIDFNSTRKLNELAEALELQDDDLFYVVRFPFTAETSFKVPFGTLRDAIATLVGSGDVIGADSSTDGNVVLFNGNTGRIIRDSGRNEAFFLNRNNHTGQQAFSTINSLPTTRAGYGIVDASPFIEVQEEGVTITSAALSFNFTGVGVTASQVDGNVTVNISGAGDMVLSANQTISGAKTFNDTTLKLFNATSTFVTTLKTGATADNNITIPASASDTLVLLGLAQTLTNKTLTSPILTTPQINMGLDAIGDLYYRNGSNVTARLAIGTALQFMRVSAGGIPEWADEPVVRYRLLGFVTGVSLNAAAPIDLAAITITGSKYIPLYALVYNSSAIASTAELGIYTAAAAGGTAVVTPAALTGLTAANKLHVLTLTAMGNAPLTAATLIPRLTVAQGTAATADIAIYGIELPS
jgi:hypothetical protein